MIPEITNPPSATTLYCKNEIKIRNRIILQTFHSIEQYNIEKENHIENHCMHQASARLGGESQG